MSSSSSSSSLLRSFYLFIGVMVALVAVRGEQIMEEESPSSSPLEPLEDYQARLSERLQEAFENQDESFAMWIGLYDPDYDTDLYFVFGNATASEEGASPPDVPATLDDTFQIGSVSKTFLGTLLLLLEGQGDLSLQNDTVEDLVPDFAAAYPVYANYTVENLLRMETLVPDFLNDENGILNDYMQDVTRRYSIEQVVEYALRQDLLVEPTYSTTNYVVAEHIVQEITGRQIEDVVKDLVFDPLQLRNMELPGRFSEGELPNPAATPFAGSSCFFEFSIFGADNLEFEQDLTDVAQGIVMSGIGGAINGNIEDLLTWAKSGTGDALLTQDMIDRRHQYTTPIADFSYGISQYSYDQPGAGYLSNWYGHDGDAFGFGALAYRNDDYGGASIAVAANTCAAKGAMVGMVEVFTKELQARYGTETTTTAVPTATPTTSSGVDVSMTESPTSASPVGGPDGQVPTEGSTDTESPPTTSAAAGVCLPFFLGVLATTVGSAWATL